MPLETAVLSQSSFLEEQSLQHIDLHLTLFHSSTLCHLASVPTMAVGCSLVLLACSREQASAPIFVPTVQFDTVDHSSWEISSAASQL